MNVMLTCAGRRSYAIRAFKETLRGGQVLACDFSAEAPALQEADRWFIVPRVDQSDYLEALFELCVEHAVRLLIPAMEPELPLLAAHRARFEAVGTIPLISSPEVVATCYDKLATDVFLRNAGLAALPSELSLAAARAAVNRGELHFPLVTKPRWGVSSMAVAFPEDDAELERDCVAAKKEVSESFLAKISATDPERSILIQQRVYGEEYGLDVVNDLDGRYVCTFARRKLRMRAGQTDRAVTVRDDRLERLGRTIGEKLRHRGPLDCDVILHGDVFYVIDLNPRLGSGYPFSHFAGANLPAALLAWANGETPDPRWFEFRPGVTVARSDHYVVVDRSRATKPGPSASAREMHPRHDRESPAALLPARFGPGEFFAEFFRRLEARGISYVVLHGYDQFPARFGSDVDYAVDDADRRKIAPLLAELARERGWVVAQTWPHELFADYSVLIDPENAANHLALDVCSHFARDGRLLLRDAVLLHDRRRHEGGFFVPAPAVEFIYLLAKTAAKNEPAPKHLPRLRQLWALDPAGIQRRVAELFGQPAPPLEAWLRSPGEHGEQLRASMRAGTRFGLALLVAETFRRFQRAMRPAGMHIALLGPDGCGKTTLLQNLERLLAPCFSRQRVFKFRPDVFQQIEPGLEPQPHRRPPRGRLLSCAKVLYYFADWWLGWCLRLRPERRRAALVVFDRDFNDLVVDQRRYLVQGIGRLARLLRRWVPRADATFILDADSHAVYARKPELPVAELERQRKLFRELAAGDRRMHVVAANDPVEEVARVVSRQIILLLAAREQRWSRPVAKRWFDLVAAAVALILLGPLLIVLAILVRVKLGTPILFEQERPGLHGRPFIIRKFRTMTAACDATGRLLPDAERLTRFGKLLRSTSLDELPELLNVLRGEMSLVGPRPLLMEYLPLYSAEQRRRHDVLPGITGWAQINGRNAASWPQKFALDLWYVDHQSLWLDLKIIALTAWRVLKRDGINQPGRATADRFLGTEECERAMTISGTTG